MSRENAPTIVAKLTPAIPSAIATIAVNGSLAVESVARLVGIESTGKLLEIGRIRYGLWNPIAAMNAAEQVVVCRTGPQQVEIHCHGGIAVCEMILGDLRQRGCIQCAASEFPSQYSDTFARDAELELQHASTERAAAILLDQLNGALSNAVAKINGLVLRGQVPAARALALDVLKWQELGKHLSSPWQVVLAGPPNVGKSSLVNAIVGNQRVIVHHEPGTTRDWVEILTGVEGWPVSITDTAGLRKTEDEIEGEGMRRALSRVQCSDLVVLVVDATQGWTETHEELSQSISHMRRLTVWNKSDLIEGTNPPEGAIITSAAQGIGTTALISAIANALIPNIPEPFTPIPFRESHVEILQRLVAAEPI